ncbi:butyrate kinase [Candidatus Formimonas warabiya]|uniref:Probable butyrate kinase n=1 Tax=Formimonas warabiya TaxID=1761012 RepID=A0A3G1L033_FORW1|nr:butyrate kinase [Candidatus Formimonas warabiya]ATW27999.1 butyrate kinase [Candidatus Formimonas warabiya]
MSEATYSILAINPGSTSTKIALYENGQQIYKGTIEHPKGETDQFKTVADQFEMRKEAIIKALQGRNFDLKTLSAVVGRGGILPPMKSGAYEVNQAMMDRLMHNPLVGHASNLGALIAHEIARPLGIKAYIYDPVTVDEYEDVARISGLPEISRRSECHALNSRAVAREAARKLNKPYDQLNIIVTHLGGGISTSLHKKGRMVDVIPDDEGPFSPERAGRVPCRQLVELCYSGKYERGTMLKRLRGQGGLTAYLGINNAREVEARIKNGDEYARLIYYAMAYQVAKGIGELATVVNGQVDRIVMTGSMAYSEMITGWIKEKVAFIAPVEVIPGEHELEALAAGALRVVKGEETAHEYVEKDE